MQPFSPSMDKMSHVTLIRLCRLSHLFWLKAHCSHFLQILSSLLYFIEKRDIWIAQNESHTLLPVCTVDVEEWNLSKSAPHAVSECRLSIGEEKKKTQENNLFYHLDFNPSRRVMSYLSHSGYEVKGSSRNPQPWPCSEAASCSYSWSSSAN